MSSLKFRKWLCGGTCITGFSEDVEIRSIYMRYGNQPINSELYITDRGMPVKVGDEIFTWEPCYPKAPRELVLDPCSFSSFSCSVMIRLLSQRIQPRYLLTTEN